MNESVRAARVIHDAIAKSKKPLVGQRFGEEVRQVVVSRHEGDNDVQVLDAFPNEEMPSFNMFHARMMLRVVRHGNRRLVVHGEVSGLGGVESVCKSPRRERRCNAYLDASEAAMISASHDESAMTSCFLDAHEIVAC